jgi:DNA polymerase-1
VLSKEALAFYGHNRVEYPVTAILETSGPNPLADQLLGIYFLGQQDSSYYWDLGPDASNASRETARGMIGAYPLVLLNSARCCTWLRHNGIETQVAADPLLAAFVLDPVQELSLQALTGRYLGNALQLMSGEPLEAGIVQRLSGELLREPLEPVAIAVRSLFDKTRSLPDWAEPIYAQELALAPVIARMELAGIAVDTAQLESIASALSRTSNALEAKLAALSAKPK